MSKLKIVFMGTPEFAVPSLKIIVENKYEVVGVVTAPDKPQGRGKKIGMSAVKEYALIAGLAILQPTNLKSPAFADQLRALHADVFVVVAFRMLPEPIWSMPPRGTFNLHASLLPQYRGAAPIHWAIINGEKETGVSTFFLQHEIDTGEIILQEKEYIDESDTVGDLYTRLMNKGAKIVLETLNLIQSATVTTTPQQTLQHIKKAPKIFKETCEIVWNQPALDVYNFIRGLSPFPAAWFNHKNKMFKVYRAKLIDADPEDTQPGDMLSDGKTYVYAKCSDIYIALLEIQPEGKKRMHVSEFLKGNNI